MKTPIINYTLKCPVNTAADGSTIGCGGEWSSQSRTEPCPGCGMLGKVSLTWEILDMPLPQKVRRPPGKGAFSAELGDGLPEV